jgi:Protein of unknown function (DUF3987)
MILQHNDQRGEAKSYAEFVDKNQVALAVRTFADPAQSFELRTFPGGKGTALRRKGDDANGIVLDALTLAGLGGSVYFCVNPSPLSLSRSACTKDADVTRRRWIFLDIDPVRASGFENDPATLAEVEAARALAGEVFEYLCYAGWHAPDSTVDSGGGMPLYWACDLPNDGETKDAITALYARLGRKFDGPRGTIDPKIRNASRVMKLPGTLAVKGEESEGRTYRPCRFIQSPRGRQTLVTLEQIRYACQEEAETPAPVETAAVPCRPSRGEAGGDYYRAALGDECNKVASASAGGRNTQLNNSAVKIGHFVPAHLDEEEVAAALLDAALAAGLPEGQSRSTIRSGMKKGMSEPKDKPPSRSERGEASQGRRENYEDPGETPIGDSTSGSARRTGNANASGTVPPPSSWPEIVPLSEEPKADPFPLDVLPGSLQTVLLEIAAALNTPPDLAAVPLLVLAGASIGMSRELEISQGHKQSPLLYAGVVGDPGSAKTPAMKPIRRPVDAIQKEYRKTWDDEMKVYAIEMEDYEAANKARHKDRARPRPRPIEPKRPILRRVVVSDTTPESLIPILQDNPRGVVSIRDELSSLVTGMDQYKSGKGTEKQFWLSIWANDPYYKDRSSTHAAGYLSCDAPFIAVVGCLTPDKLKTIRGDERGRKAPDDGFIDRVLFSFPELLPARGETWHGESAATRATLDRVIRNLHTLDMIGVVSPVDDEITSYRPRVIVLTQCGRDAWQEFTERHAAQWNAEDFPLCLKGPWSKLRGYCGRLALILHYLRWACGEVEGEGDIDGNTMRDAARLVGYFKSHARKVYHALDADRMVAVAGRLLRAIERHLATDARTDFSARDAHRLARPDRLKPAEVQAPLDLLSAHGYIRKMPPVEKAGVGRKPSDRYEANPGWHSGYSVHSVPRS